MTDDKTRSTYFTEKGKFKKGHPGLNQHQKLNPPDPTDASDTSTDFDTAILEAAASFGTSKKPKVGLAGYCATLRDTRPVEYAALVTKALSRKQFAQDRAAAAIPITVEFVTCPENYFIPSEQARAEWAARTGERPVLVVDNSPDTDAITFSDDPDDAG